MTGIERIGNYIDLLEHQLGWDIILYDESGLLSGTPIAVLPQLGKWHTNAYCLRIKGNRRLRARCVRLKPNFVDRVRSGKGVVKSTCHCGVTEYAMPITYKGELLCIVAATGFCGDLSERVCRHLSERMEMPLDQLMELRGSALRVGENEGHVVAAMEILSRLLAQYIMEETKIPKLLDDAECDGNAYITLARRYITQHFSDPIQTEAVARHCHLSKSHLEHLFSRTLGHGVAEEIRLCRLQYAKELLCTTDYTVKYIAFLSGFSSSDYFATAFRKQVGVTPLRYRKGER